MKAKRLLVTLLAAGVIVSSLGISGCGETQTTGNTTDNSAKQEAPAVEENNEADSVDEEEGSVAAAEQINAPEISGLTFESEMELEYAEGFQVFYYSGGYKYISIPLSGTYLVVPEGGEVPEQLPEADTTVIYQDLSQIYLAGTSVMSFFDCLDAIDQITMTGTSSNGWYIDAPKEALAAGTMAYAGKYSEPDYEMLVENDCDLAIESTMIYHAPEVQEMLEDLEIPVFIDRSSYELTAFGRVEWIKVYGALINKEAEANAFFEDQEQILAEMEEYENTGKTVAFFSINSSGSIVVRKSDDFIPNMIELGGAKYIFEDLQNPGSNSASVQINMEEFYDVAENVDYLVYNATIEDPISSVDSLIAKDELFAEFKAVQNGDVWQVDKTWYQSTATVGHLITDFNIMVTDGDRSKLTFLSKVGE